MIPATYPSVLDVNNRTKMVVYELTSVTGLTRWVDYIPVKSPASESDTSLANTYANAGFILSNALTSVTGLQAFKDYIPIYVDNAATVPWTTDANGYIPLSDLFSIPSLFANNEQGLWYDPSDFTSMFQDAAGTIPVTAVEQPVGLIIDKRNGGVLNPQLVTNSTFDTDTDWTKGTGWTIGSGVATKTAGTSSVLSQSESLVVGKRYRIVYTITRTAGSITPRFSGGTFVTGTSKNVSGTYVDFITAVTGNNVFEFSADSAFAGTVDNVYIREVTGNDGYQITSASRPTLKALYNLLTYTEQFDNTAWSKFELSITTNIVVAPDGTTSADKFISTTTNAVHSISVASTSIISGVTYTMSIFAKKDEYKNIVLRMSTGFTNTYQTFNLDTGTLGTNAGTSPINPTITSIGNGWYRCSMSATATSTTAFAGILIYVADDSESVTFTGNGVNGLYGWGADLRVTNDGIGLPNYQRVNAATDYDTTGFPPYLSYDGTDDHMLSQTVNLSSTDTALVVAGQRKLKDATSGPLVFSAQSATTPIIGSFALYAPGTSTNTSYRFTSRGSLTAVNADTGVTNAAPHTGVVSGIGSISGDLSRIRVNGTTITTTSTDQGTGNYAAASGFVVGRNGTAGTVFYQGRLYNLVVRCAASTDTEITNTENYVNSKTKAY